MPIAAHLCVGDRVGVSEGLGLGDDVGASVGAAEGPGVGLLGVFEGDGVGLNTKLTPSLRMSVGLVCRLC
jgi:hypothetical protein